MHHIRNKLSAFILPPPSFIASGSSFHDKCIMMHTIHLLNAIMLRHNYITDRASESSLIIKDYIRNELLMSTIIVELSLSHSFAL